MQISFTNAKRSQDKHFSWVRIKILPHMKVNQVFTALLGRFLFFRHTAFHLTDSHLTASFLLRACRDDPVFYQVSRAIQDGGVSLGPEPVEHLLLGTHTHRNWSVKLSHPSSWPALSLCVCSVTCYLIPHSSPGLLPVFVFVSLWTKGRMMIRRREMINTIHNS